MAKTIKCRGAGCNFESKLTSLGIVSLVGGKAVPGLYCPECREEYISYKGEGSEYIFKCNNCGEKWTKLPCPECGAGISPYHTKGLFG